MAVRDRDGGGSLFPSWKALLSGAADRLAREDKPAPSKLVLAHLDMDPPMLLDAARHARRALGPSWFDLLAERFDPPRSRAEPESLTLARAVWTLGSNLIVTTNYDRVLQWAAPEPDDLRTWDIEAPVAQSAFLREGSKVPVVWHLHGQVDRVERMILTPDGYRRLYGSKAAKSRHQAAIATLHSLLASRSFLFVGFSMADELFDKQLRHVSTTFKAGNGPHYALICASQVDGVKALGLPIEVVTFADFGQPLLDLIADIANAAASAAGARSPLPLGAGQGAASPSPIFTVPFRSKGKHVVDREGALNELRRQLVAGRATEWGHTAALCGLGGLGKTQLAVEYAYRFREAYPDGVFWINADQELDPQLLAFSDQAGWFSPGSDASYKLEVARQKVNSANRALLVLDNLERLDSIAPLLESPPPDRHLLVTTQYDFPEFFPVELDRLDEHASLKLLLQEAGYEPKNNQDWKAAREIAHAMDGLPLALELAGAYLCQRRIGWSRYLGLLKDDLRAALHNEEFFHSLTKHQVDLYRTLTITKKVFGKAPLLEEVLDVLTWSGSAPMSIGLLSHLLGPHVPADLEGAIGLGVKLRLLQDLTPDKEEDPASSFAGQQQEDRGLFAIHRLVREVRRLEAPLANRPAWAAAVGTRLIAWFEPKREYFEELSRFEAEIDHLRAWEVNASEQMPELHPKVIWLQAYPLYHHGLFPEAGDVLARAEAAHGRSPLPDAAFEGKLRTDVSLVHQALGNGAKAVESARKAVALLRGALGSRDPETAKALSMLGAAERASRDFGEALKAHKRARAIWRGLWGDNHPDTANAVVGVGNTYFAMGDYKRALRWYRRALPVFRNALGEKHPDTVKLLSNLGHVYTRMGKYEEALSYFLGVLTIRSEVLEERDPDTINSLRNVGNIYAELREFAQALEYQQRVMELTAVTHGSRSGEAVRATVTYGITLFNAGREAEAIGLLTQLRSGLYEDDRHRMHVKEVMDWLLFRAAARVKPRSPSGPVRLIRHRSGTIKQHPAIASDSAGSRCQIASPEADLLRGRDAVAT